MKKNLLVILVAAMALAFSMPALAVDVDFSGEYRIRGFYNDNPNLLDDSPGNEDDSAAWLDHRFRLQTVFKANDNVSVTTRMDVFDEQPFGDESIFFDTYSGDDNDDIDVDALYLTVMSPIGLFKAGRIPGGSVWGTDLANTGEDFAFDRIEYFAKTGDLIFGAIYEKLTEDNSLYMSNFDNEGDCDTYYLVGVYKKENLEIGTALRYQDLDEVADLIDNTPIRELVDGYDTVAGMLGFHPYLIDDFLPPGMVPHSSVLSAISSIYYNYDIVQNFAIAPYVKAAVGPFNIEAEFIYETGKYEADNKVTTLDGTLTPVKFKNREIEALTYKVEAALNLDRATFNLGFASAEGQDYSELMKPDGDITIGNVLYHGLGDDFEPLLILTNDVGGKPLNNGYTTMLSGVDLLYGGFSFALNDKLTLRGAIGQAWTNEDDYCDGEDDLGFEVDLGLTWKVMDNLTCKFDVGYLDKGDEVLEGTTLRPASGEGDETIAAYTEVSVTF